MTDLEVLLALALTDEEANCLFEDPDLWTSGGPTNVREMAKIFYLYVTADKDHGSWSDSARIDSEYTSSEIKKELKDHALTYFERQIMCVEYEFGGENWNVQFSDGSYAEREVTIEGEAEFFKWLVGQGYFKDLEGGIETIIEKLHELRENP